MLYSPYQNRILLSAICTKPAKTRTVMKYAQSITCALVSLLSIRSLAQDQADTPISDASCGADFICHSSILKISNTEFDIERSITNRAHHPLSVQWRAAGILRTGWWQISPGETARADPETTDYPKPKPSDVQYGLHIDHSKKADVHFVPTPQSAAAEPIRRRTELTAVDGHTYSIEVISALNKDRKSSQFTIRLTKGLAVIVPRALATQLMLTEKTNGDIEDWLCKEIEINPRDETRAGFSQWLDLGERGGPANILEMYKRKRDPDRLAIITSGQKWAVESVPLLAVLPDKPGGFGIVAELYQPADKLYRPADNR
jgi:hypothetical protein